MKYRKVNSESDSDSDFPETRNRTNRNKIKRSKSRSVFTNTKTAFHCLCLVTTATIIYQVYSSSTSYNGYLKQNLIRPIKFKIDPYLHKQSNSPHSREFKYLNKVYEKKFENDKMSKLLKRINLEKSSVKFISNSEHIITFQFYPIDTIDLSVYRTGKDVIQARLVLANGFKQPAVFLANVSHDSGSYVLEFDLANPSGMYKGGYTDNEKNYLSVVKIANGRDIELIDRLYQLPVSLGISYIEMAKKPVLDENDVSNVKCHVNRTYLKHYVPRKTEFCPFSNLVCQCHDQTSFDMNKYTSNVKPFNFGFVNFLDEKKAVLGSEIREIVVKSSYEFEWSSEVQPSDLRSKLVDSKFTEFVFIGDATIKQWFDHFNTLFPELSCTSSFNNKKFEFSPFEENIKQFSPKSCSFNPFYDSSLQNLPPAQKLKISYILHGQPYLEAEVRQDLTPDEVVSLRTVLGRESEEKSISTKTIFIGIGLHWTLFGPSYFENRISKILEVVKNSDCQTTGDKIVFKTLEYVKSRPHSSALTFSPYTIHKFNEILKILVEPVECAQIADTWSMTFALQNELVLGNDGGKMSEPYLEQDLLGRILNRVLNNAMKF